VADAGTPLPSETVQAGKEEKQAKNQFVGLKGIVI
jgi:hypothetical protein